MHETCCVSVFVINIKAVINSILIIFVILFFARIFKTLMKSEEIKMKKINNNLVTVLFTFKLGISLVKKTVCGMII